MQKAILAKTTLSVKFRIRYFNIHYVYAIFCNTETFFYHGRIDLVKIRSEMSLKVD